MLFIPLRMIWKDRKGWPSGNTIITLINTSILYRINNLPNSLIHCGYAVVERIAMAKRKASEPLERYPKKINSSTDFVNYQPALNPKIRKVSSTKIGKRPIYKFFIDFDGKYFPLRCMLDNRSTSFVVSPEAAKAFSIPVVKRSCPIKT